MKADQGILQRLDAATKAPYWPVGADGAWCFRILHSFFVFLNSFLFIRLMKLSYWD